MLFARSPFVRGVKMIDMGGMILADYAYLIGLLGLVCGLAFVMGLKQ